MDHPQKPNEALSQSVNQNSKQLRLHAWIDGLVQGVSFRAYTKHEADRLRLTGWVQNLSDGRVEVVAEGPQAAVEELLSWLHHGPRWAKVSNVDSDYSPATGEFQAFRVLHDG